MWMHTDALHSVQRQMFDLLEGWLRHKSDMVNLEAARVICEMKNVTPTQLTRSIAGKFSTIVRRLVPPTSFHSPATLPFVTKVYAQVCRNPDTSNTCCHSSAKRGCVQHGLGESHLRPKS